VSLSCACWPSNENDNCRRIVAGGEIASRFLIFPAALFMALKPSNGLNAEQLPGEEIESIDTERYITSSNSVYRYHPLDACDGLNCPQVSICSGGRAETTASPTDDDGGGEVGIEEGWRIAEMDAEIRLHARTKPFQEVADFPASQKDPIACPQPPPSTRISR